MVLLSRWLSLTIFLASMAACQDGQAIPNGQETGTAPTQEPAGIATSSPTVAPDAVAAIVDNIDPSQPQSLDTVEDLIRLGRGAAPELRERINAPDFVRRWAALYYFSRLAEAEDIPALIQALNDTDQSNRTVAAATLLRLGDERGLTILQDALNSERTLAFSEPPILLSDYARRVLSQLRPDLLVRDGHNRPVGGAGVLAAPIPAPPSVPFPDISVSESDCAIEIVLNLQYHGAGITPALAATWERAILNTWNGQLSSGCCDVQLSLNWKIGGDADPEFAQVDVVNVPPGGNHRSEMTLGNSGNSGDLSGSWDNTDTTGSVAAHEVGHALGIDDEYVDDPATGGSVPTGDAIGEGSGAGAEPSIMAQTWSDSEGDAASSKIRHSDSILAAYGVECPEECLQNWTVRQPTPTLIPPPTATPTPTPEPTPTPTVSAVVTIKVLIYDGRNFPMERFNVAEPDACSFKHYHPKGGSAYSLDLTLYIDPNPPACGFGTVQETPVRDVVVTKAEYDAYLETVGASN